MRRWPLLLMPLLIAGFLPGIAHAQRPLLEGKTGPGFTITLERDGKRVRTLNVPRIESGCGVQKNV